MVLGLWVVEAVAATWQSQFTCTPKRAWLIHYRDEMRWAGAVQLTVARLHCGRLPLSCCGGICWSRTHRRETPSRTTEEVYSIRLWQRQCHRLIDQRFQFRRLCILASVSTMAHSATEDGRPSFVFYRASAQHGIGLQEPTKGLFTSYELNWMNCTCWQLWPQCVRCEDSHTTKY